MNVNSLIVSLLVYINRYILYKDVLIIIVRLYNWDGVFLEILDRERVVKFQSSKLDLALSSV